ncbi:MAG TPA: alpha-amylase family glycosyl hydrolase [Candidatus Limnocylindrales bacterium]|nr:alpha-amylase family glycosyl hydrolase [Candidatus Limnocylindrales bacterium]
MSRRSGVRTARPARERYDPDLSLHRPDGSVPMGEGRIARALAARMNRARAGDLAPGSPGVGAGELYALGVIHEVFHYLVERYEDEARPEAVAAALAAVRTARGARRADGLRRAFLDDFPDRLVGAPEAAGEAQEPAERPEATLEELILTRIANENPAAAPLRDLFDDRPLAERADYEAAIATLDAFFAAQPGFGPDGETLLDMLRAPARHSPTSLAGQLRYIRERWGSMLGDLLDRLLIALDVIAEEERALHLRFGGGGGSAAEAPEFGGLDAEPERFSSDSEWMPRLVLIAKSTYVWLDQLSRWYERDIRTLDAIPDEELDRLARAGITGLWLIGLWERSIASERIKRRRGNPDAVASAYSLDDYRIAGDLGGDGAYANLRERAWARGIRLSADMVPNHMGIDSRWVTEHPEWFISLPWSPYPGYSFNGPDLSSHPDVGIVLEDHYWDNTDAAVVFKRFDRRGGEDRYIYHGNDGTSFPWNDTAQLDFLKPEVREQVIRTILDVARRFPIIRFDAAMVLAKKHISRLWYPEPGSGGAIPSRAEHGSMPKAAFDAAIPVEFWREVVDRVAAEVPDTLLLAEAFWLLEGYFVRTLGMHRVYNSAFMHMLRDEDNAGYRRVIKETLEFDPEILKRYVNFMNNPDEKTAVEQFGKGDKYFGVASLLATLPGLPMLGHGQIEGFGEKYGMEFRRATQDERPDPWLVERHEREIFPLFHRRGMFAGAEDFLLYDFEADGGGIDEHVYAYSNGRGAGRSLVVYHNRFASTAGRIRESAAYAQKAADGSKTLVRRPLGDALELPGGADDFIAFRDARTGLEYLRAAAEVRQGGLWVRLDAYQGHVFWDFRTLHDGVAGQWRRLAERLGGAGVPSLDEALRELQLEPVHEPLRALVGGPLGGLVRDGTAPSDDTGTALGRFADAVRAATGTTGETAGYTSTAADRLRMLARAADEGAGDGAGAPAAADPWRRAVLAGWAILEPLGRLATGAIVGPTSRAWYDELRLGQALAAGLRAAGLDEGAAWSAAERVRLLVALPRPSNVGGRSTADRARRLVAAWISNPDARTLLRVNRWEDVDWFGGDEWNEALDLAVDLDALDGPPAAHRTARSVVDSVRPLAESSGYRLDRLADLVGPAPKARQARPATARPGAAGRPSPRNSGSTARRRTT